VGSWLSPRGLGFFQESKKKGKNSGMYIREKNVMK
jgi:hypothetical protein